MNQGCSLCTIIHYFRVIDIVLGSFVIFLCAPMTGMKVQNIVSNNSKSNEEFSGIFVINSSNLAKKWVPSMDSIFFSLYV